MNYEDRCDNLGAATCSNFLLEVQYNWVLLNLTLAMCYVCFSDPSKYTNISACFSRLM